MTPLTTVVVVTGEGGGYLGPFERGMWAGDQNEHFVTMAGDRIEWTLLASKLVPAIESLFSNMYQRTWVSNLELINLFDSDWLQSDGKRQVQMRKLERKGGLIAENGSKTITDFLITIAAAMLPALSILGLYFENDILKRIGIMIGLTTAFAAVLAIFTEAKRIEIFSAVAAFAAIEVVFIGTADIKNLT